MKKIIYTDRSNANVKFILSSIRPSEPLTTEQEYDLWQRMSCGSEKAREQLIFANLR